MVEIVLVNLATPKAHVGNLEIAPEMASRVTVGLFVVFGAAGLVRQPVERIVHAIEEETSNQKLPPFFTAWHR